MTSDDRYSTSISRMEWIIVRRNDTATVRTGNDNEDDNSKVSPRWNFTKVFDELTKASTGSGVTTPSKPVTQSSIRRNYYFNRINGRCGWRIFDTDETFSNEQTFSSTGDGHDTSRKRKRTDHDLWKIRYIDSAVLTSKTITPMNDTIIAHVREPAKNNIGTMVDPQQLIPIYNCDAASISTVPGNSKVPILITDTTEIYRLLAASQVHTRHMNEYSGCDVGVLEIGSSTGMTSAVVWQQLQQQHRRWIGLDTGADMVKTVQEKLNDSKVNNEVDGVWATCHHIDPLLDPDTASLLVMQHLLSCCVVPTIVSDQINTKERIESTQLVTVLIDIGGNREEGAVLRMIDWVLRTFQSSLAASTNFCRLFQIIIKSESIFSTLSSYVENKQEKVRDESNVQSSKDWYMAHLRTARRNSLPRHPLQAPKRFVLPLTSMSDSSVSTGDIGEQRLICRYHNYHKAGCAKMNNKVTNDNDDCTANRIRRAVSHCPHDHDHCHVCVAPGHIARHCPFVFD